METQLVYLSIPQGTLEKLEIVAAQKGLAVEQVGSGTDRRVFGTPTPPEFFGVRIERTHPRTLFWHSQRHALIKLIADTPAGEGRAEALRPCPRLEHQRRAGAGERARDSE